MGYWEEENKVRIILYLCPERAAGSQVLSRGIGWDRLKGLSGEADRTNRWLERREERKYFRKNVLARGRQKPKAGSWWGKLLHNRCCKILAFVDPARFLRRNLGSIRWSVEIVPIDGVLWWGG